MSLILIYSKYDHISLCIVNMKLMMIFHIVFMLNFQNLLCISHLNMSWVGLATQPQGVSGHLGASGASALHVGECVGGVGWKGWHMI